MSKISVSGDKGVGEVSMTELVLLFFLDLNESQSVSGTITTIKSSPNEVKFCLKKTHSIRFTKPCSKNIGHYKRTSTIWPRRKTMHFRGYVMCREMWTVSETTKPIS